MKSAFFRGPKAVELVELPTPRAKDDITLVHIDVAPMCTEYKAYLAGDLTAMMGHEAAGHVVDPGRSHRVVAGERVVVMPQNGCGRCALCTSGDHIYCPHQRDVLSETGSQYGTTCFSDHILKADWLLLPIPDDISTEHASMACCALGPSFNAIRTTRTSADDTVLVLGCGPVGLGAIINARDVGARVLAVDPSPYRCDLAMRLGAEIAVDPTDEREARKLADTAGDRGVDVIFDSVAIPATMDLAIRLARPRARIGCVVHKPLIFDKIVTKGLSVFGCWHWNHQRDGERMFNVIRRQSGLLDILVTHRFPLEAIDDALRLQVEGNCGKVLLTTAQS